MKTGTLDIFRNEKILIKISVQKTESIFERLCGLMGKERMLDEGLWIKPCNSVHTFFMRFAIDVVYLDRNGTVKKIISSMNPCRLSQCFRAHSVVELTVGMTDKLDIQVGDQCVWHSN